MLNFFFGKKSWPWAHNSERGFTIPEVLVGLVIVTGVTVAGSRMFKDQKLGQKKVEYDAALTAFHSTVVKHLSNANNCNATLRDYGGSAAGAWAKPAAIYSCTGCTSPDVDYDASVISIPNASRTVWLRHPLTAPAGDRWIEATNDNNSFSTRSWKIEDWTLTPPASGTTGQGKLTILYRLNPDLPYGGRSVNKEILLNLRFSTDTTPAVFRECFSSAESSVNNLQNDICNSMTSQFGSTGVLMRWNDATQKCERTGTPGAPVKACPPGTVVEGVRSDGSVHCKSLVEGVNPGQDLMLESPCPPGGSIKLEIVDGKVVTRCL